MGLYSVVSKDVALTAATTKTLLQVVAGSTKRLKLVEFGVSFDGVTASAVPVDVDLLRQTSAGTASAATVVKLDEAEPAAIFTAQATVTAEPTAGDVLASWQVTPNGGVLVVQYAEGREPVVAASGRLAIRALAAAGVNVSVYAIVAE